MHAFRHIRADGFLKFSRCAVDRHGVALPALSRFIQRFQREKAVGPLGKQVFFKNVFPRNVLHQGHQLLVFKQRISRADRHRACEIVVVQQHQRAGQFALVFKIRKLLFTIGRRVVRPRRIGRIPAMVVHIVMLCDIPSQIIRNLARAGGVQMLVRVKTIRRIIGYLIHAHKIDVVQPVIFRDICDGVRVHLLLLVRRIRQMHQQHVDPPRLTILDDLSQIDKARLPALLRRHILINQVVISDVRHSDDAFRALLPVVNGVKIRIRQFAPARVILAQRKQIFPLHVHIGHAVVVHRVRIIHQIVESFDFGLGNRVTVKRRVYVAAVAGELVALAYALHIQHNQLRLRIVQRILQRPIRDGEGVAITGDIVARNAVFFPHFHRENARVHDAVAEEQHVVFPRAVKKRLHLLPAFLALNQSAYPRDDAKKQHAERNDFQNPFSHVFSSFLFQPFSLWIAEQSIEREVQKPQVSGRVWGSVPNLPLPKN